MRAGTEGWKILPLVAEAVFVVADAWKILPLGEGLPPRLRAGTEGWKILPLVAALMAEAWKILLLGASREG